MEKQKRDILTKQDMDRSEMIRFVRGPECKVYADLEEKLPGRGMWLKAERESLLEAIQKRAFSKSCHEDCSNIDKSFADEVTILLKKRLFNLISLSKKSGDLILGFDKVVDKIKQNSIAVLLIASDSGEDGKKKLQYKLSNNCVLIEDFTGSELQEVLGQDTVVVYASINKSKLSDKIIEVYSKLKGFV